MPQPGRRSLLLGAAAMLLAGRAGAQDAATPTAPAAEAPAAEAPAAAAPAPAAAPPRRPRRRRVVRRREPPPEPAPPPEASEPRLEAAPVPNRSVEGPRIAAPSENPSFGPSIIHRPLPNTSAAREGARNYDEERLFFPAPGARLTVPFSY